jgi:hypothetical protein
LPIRSFSSIALLALTRAMVAAQQLAEADPAGWAIGLDALPASLRDN